MVSYHGLEYGCCCDKPKWCNAQVMQRLYGDADVPNNDKFQLAWVALQHVVAEVSMESPK